MLDQVKEFNEGQNLPVQGFTSPNRATLQQVHEYMNQTTIGHIDAIGCFHLHTKKFHVDPFQEDQLSFFKKITYPEKLKEIHDSYMFSLGNYVL